MPLSRQEIEELLAQPLLAHLGVVKGGKPHVSPVWVWYKDGVFYFSTRLGRAKGGAISAEPSVSLSVATDTTPYKGLVAEGKAELIEEDKWGWMERIISKYVSSRFGKKEGERVLEGWRREPDRVAYRVRPARLFSWNYGRGDLQKQDEGVSMSTEIGPT